jgi:hypothetical protein
MDLVVRLDHWFAERLRGLRYTPETIAYVVGVLSRKNWDVHDMSTESVVLAFQNASLKCDFSEFQRIGDWVLFIDIVHPIHLDGVREAIESIGRNSYYSCHRILRGQWRVYEELADELPTIARHMRHKLA